MSVVDNKLWSDYEPLPSCNEDNDVNQIEEIEEIKHFDDFEYIEGYSTFELLLNDLREDNIFDFINLDWKCLSGMKGFSKKFIVNNFKYFNVYTLITANNFDENFLVEILDCLIPFYEKNFNMIFDKARILKVFKQTNKCVLSEKFNSRTYPECKIVYKEYKNSKVVVNKSFENIVDFLKKHHPKDYLELDVKSFSSFRILSIEFILNHIYKLDIGMLCTNQKFELDFITQLNKIVNIPFNPLFVSHIKKMSLDFILELIPFDKTVKNKKNNEKIQKSILKNILPINFNKSLDHHTDDSILYKSQKYVYEIHSYDTMYIKYY